MVAWGRLVEHSCCSLISLPAVSMPLWGALDTWSLMVCFAPPLLSSGVTCQGLVGAAQGLISVGRQEWPVYFLGNFFLSDRLFSSMWLVFALQLNLSFCAKTEILNHHKNYKFFVVRNYSEGLSEWKIPFKNCMLISLMWMMFCSNP